MNEEIEDIIEPTELELLKGRADLLGIKYHPSIGVSSLRAKIDDILSDKVVEPVLPKAVLNAPVVATAAQKNAFLRREAAKLVRIRVTNMNPNKKEYEGETFTVSNSVVGTFRKYVPFNGEPYHVPNIILKMILDRKCQVFYTANVDGVKKRVGKLVAEFAVEILSPLTPKELTELGRIQAMRSNQD